MTREHLTAKLAAVERMEAHLNAARLELAAVFFGEYPPMRALIGVDIDATLMRSEGVRASLQAALDDMP
jgi:hypothetical protein